MQLFFLKIYSLSKLFSDISKNIYVIKIEITIFLFFSKPINISYAYSIFSILILKKQWFFYIIISQYQIEKKEKIYKLKISKFISLFIRIFFNSFFKTFFLFW